MVGGLVFINIFLVDIYPGGSSQLGISSSASGAKGRTDECLASLLIEVVIMLANLEADRRKEAKQMKV